MSAPQDSIPSQLFARRTAAMPVFGIPEIDRLAARHGSELISFAGGAPHLVDLPFADVSRITAELFASGDQDLLAYGDPQGEPELLSELVPHLSAQGLAASRERILVTSGALQGLDVVFGAFLDPGDLVVLEEPTYSDVISTLSRYEVETATLPMDGDGATVAKLDEVSSRFGRPPKLIYVMPTFHNPTGLTMSPTRRRMLLDFAADHHSTVVEDNAYGAFCFAGKPVPPLATMDDRVVYVYSMSKVVAPGLRVGCVVAPTEVIEQLQLAKQAADICTSVLSQRIVSQFLSEGLLEPHVAELCGRLAERKRSLDEALARHMGDVASWTNPAGGMFTWVELQEGTDVDALLPLALDAGVAFIPGSVFSTASGCPNALRLCFSRVASGAIDEGVRRLRCAYDRAANAP